MLDKRILEQILSDQQEELEIRRGEVLCHRPSPKTRKREIEGLLLAHRKTKCEQLLLLTDHEYNLLEEKGAKIKILPVYNWIIELNRNS